MATYRWSTRQSVRARAWVRTHVTLSGLQISLGLFIGYVWVCVCVFVQMAHIQMDVMYLTAETSVPHTHTYIHIRTHTHAPTYKMFKNYDQLTKNYDQLTGTGRGVLC